MQRSNYRKLLPAVIFVPFSKKKYTYFKTEDNLLFQ